MEVLTPSVLPKELDIVVTGEKNCLVTWVPATSTVSVEIGPSTDLPSTYSILKLP